jgi:hypothetical protein
MGPQLHKALGTRTDQQLDVYIVSDVSWESASRITLEAPPDVYSDTMNRRCPDDPSISSSIAPSVSHMD